jgi:hypothetical protein
MLRGGGVWREVVAQGSCHSGRGRQDGQQGEAGAAGALRPRGRLYARRAARLAQESPCRGLPCPTQGPVPLSNHVVCSPSRIPLG